MSLFEVIRKIQRGELQSETVDEDGRTVQYVLSPRTSDSTSEPEAAPSSAPIEDSERYDALIQEIRLLRHELTRLHATISRCCDGRGTQGVTREEG